MSIRSNGPRRRLTPLGAFVETKLLARGMTFRNLATTLSVSNSFVTAMLNGTKRVPARHLETMARIFCLDDHERRQLRALWPPPADPLREKTSPQDGKPIDTDPAVETPSNGA